MDKATATSFVERIEAHRKAEEAIWQEMRDRADYCTHDDKTIESIIKQRRTAADLLSEAEADLDAYDWVENEEGEFVPRENA